MSPPITTPPTAGKNHQGRREIGVTRTLVVVITIDYNAQGIAFHLTES